MGVRYAKLLSDEAAAKLSAEFGVDPRPRVPIHQQFVSKFDEADWLYQQPRRKAFRHHGQDDFPLKSTEARDYDKRSALLEAQNHRCGYCGQRVFDHIKDGAHNRATIDEVVPRAAGGRCFWSNQIIACHLCNQGRGAMNAYRYFAYVQKFGRWMAHQWGREQHRAAALRLDQQYGKAHRQPVIDY